MTKHITILLLTLLLLPSCNNKKSDSSCIVIDLAGNVRTPEKLSMTLDDMAEIVNIIPIETSDSTLLSFVRFGGTTKDNIIISDPQSLYFVNKKDGTVLKRLNKVGNGPGEYINIAGVTVDERDQAIYLFDLNKNKLNRYDFNLKYVNTISNDSIGRVGILDDGNYVVSYAPLSGTEFCIGIYDKNWNHIRSGVPRSYDPKEMLQSHMLPVNITRCFNGEQYFQETYNDTLYRVTTDRQVPSIIIDKGQYKMPWEIRIDYNRRNKEGNNYISSDYGDLVSKYYFLTSEYDLKRYYDIWDTETGQLIYRGVDTPNGGTRGISLSVNGVEMIVWPEYVDGDHIYCTIDAAKASQFLPSLSEDSNPVILELKLKK